MGTWDFGIFDDDIALDLKYQFEDALAEGLSVGDATKSILESEDYSIDDPDDTPVICLALAALQLEHGALEPAIRDKALAVIDEEQGRDRWDEEPGGWAKRKAALLEFREKLAKA